MRSIFLEAEAFDRLGGWVVDEQSVLAMGSAYLMAHGMGVPVEDATTAVDVPEAGTWTFWARTRDWTAVWKRGTPAGRFLLRVNGRPLEAVLGTNGPDWDWQKAGSVWLDKGPASLALQDLTGFCGRCDALYMTLDPLEVPERDPRRLAAFRAQKAGVTMLDDPGDYDLVVAGGGMAGLCTAVSAIRQGLRVALIESRPLLGGCNSSDIRVGMGGRTHIGPYPKLGNVVQEVVPVMGGGGTFEKEWYEDFRKQNVFRLHRPELYRLALNETVVRVERSPEAPDRIAAIVTRSARSGQETRYRAPLFADCTGDAVLARMMGCETMYGREGHDRFGEQLAIPASDRQVMGHSVLWYAKDRGRPCPFPDVDWGIEFTDETALYIRGGDWEWESGQYRDQADETEAIRDYGMMAVYANWSFLKNRSARRAEWANDELDWVSPIGGKRESYRVAGDHILTQTEVEAMTVYPDATACMSWSIDLHFPEPDNEARFGQPFRSCAYHRDLEEYYPVPYRCLYARDVRNLFLGGRHISLTHLAFASARVMRTLGMLGEVVGMAAAVCRRHKAEPRAVYERYLDELKALMEAGVPVPSYHNPGKGNRESYHFKDEGWFHLYPDFDIPEEDAAIRRKIRSLQVRHKHEHPPI